MTPPMLSLTWDAYQKNICKGLSCMQERAEFVDMTLAADGHYVKVHRMVLSLVSPYIKELITSIDCPHPVIFLNNVSYPTLCSILEYIYAGEVMVKKENLSELLQVAKALHIKGLVDMVYTISNDKATVVTQELSMNDTVHDSGNDFVDSQNISAVEDMETYTDGNVSDTECEDTPKLLIRKKSIIKKQDFEIDDPSMVHYTISNQGGLQLILNRYIYNMRYINKKKNIRRWKCKDYPRALRCPAFVTTENSKVRERKCIHNHGFHDKAILKKFRAGLTYSSINEAEFQAEINKKQNKLKENDTEDDIK